jgi:repressor LexA
MKEMSETQERVLRFIQAFRIENGMPPTLRDICRFLGAASTYAAHGHIAALVSKGMLKHKPMVARGLSLTGEGYLALQKPGGSRHEPP